MERHTEAATRVSGGPRDRVPNREDRVAGCRRRLRVLDVLSVVVVIAPFVVVAGVYGASGHHLVLGGDQALLGLDAFDLRHLEQGVGSYSRMGWAHPGPAWYYLLGPLYWAFGSTGSALVMSTMVVNALAAALVVVAAGTGRRWQRPLMAGIVLLYVLRMPAPDFVAAWNPFALLLPMLLFLVLAARVAAGSVAAFGWSLVVASFLVQTHVGTVPEVGVVVLVEVVALAVLLRDRSRRPGRRARVQAGIGVGVAVLMWVPPLVQQVTAEGPGNLRMLAAYFLHGGDGGATHTWTEAFSAVGRMLGAPVYGWPAEPALLTTIMTPAVVAAVVVQLVGGVLVVLVGRRVSPPAAWLGAVSSAGTLAALVSAKTVTGPMWNHLILWVTALPAFLLFAVCTLVVAVVCRLAAERPPVGGLARRWLHVRWVPHAVAGGLVTASALGAVGVGLSLHQMASTRLYGEPGVADATALVVGTLPPAGEDGPRILLDITDVDVWTTATGLALQLEQAGYSVTVDDKWVYGFGTDRRATGEEDWTVVLQMTQEGLAGPSGQLGVVAGLRGPEAVLAFPLTAP